MAATEWEELISKAIDLEVTDIHLTAGQHIFFRHEGSLIKQAPMCSEDFLANFLPILISPEAGDRLKRDLSLDFAWEYGGRRFRGNAYFQRGQAALTLRLLPGRIPTLEELQAPAAFGQILAARHGLCLVTGRTGSGKTTTLAALLNAFNEQQAAHIVTLEDPIEFLHTPKESFFSQRELHRDFHSFPAALKSALREAADIILVGEIRDQETMETALMAAEAGALVLGSLHTPNCAETARRVEGMFPAAEKDGVRERLAASLLGIFSQRLIPAKEGGRLSLTEVLLANAATRNLIRQGNFTQLNSVMLGGLAHGMQTFQTALRERRRAGLITEETLRAEEEA